MKLTTADRLTDVTIGSVDYMPKCFSSFSE